MKKLIGVAAVGAILVALSGCANTAAPGESKGSQFLQHYMDELKSQFRGTPRK